jgi:hypothetical protein
MTARRFGNTCPDCDRWRCVCLDHEAADMLPEEYSPAERVVPQSRVGGSIPPAGGHVRTGPAPTYVREKLAALREEFLTRAGGRRA